MGSSGGLLGEGVGLRGKTLVISWCSDGSGILIIVTLVAGSVRVVGRCRREREPRS